jgi:fatty acid desaturase
VLIRRRDRRAILLLGYWLRSIIGPVLLALALWPTCWTRWCASLNAMRLGRPMAVFVVFVLFIGDWAGSRSGS